MISARKVCFATIFDSSGLSYVGYATLMIALLPRIMTTETVVARIFYVIIIPVVPHFPFYKSRNRSFEYFV